MARKFGMGLFWCKILLQEFFWVLIFVLPPLGHPCHNPGGVHKLDKLNEQNCTRDSRMTYNAKQIYYELKLDIPLFILIGQ